KLPPEIRVHVERMRGEMVHLPIPPQAHDAAAAGKAYTRRLEVMPGATPGEAVAPRIKMRSIPAVPGQPPQLAELHKKMDQMLKAVQERGPGQGSIDQLQKEVDRLRQDVDALQKQLKERN